MLSPVLWTAMAVTKPTNIAFVDPPQFFYEPSFDSFVNLWQTTKFYSYLINTLVVAVISTVFALLIGVPAAYALSRFPGWISTVLLVAALIFRALPRFAVVLPMYDISRALGLYDTHDRSRGWPSWRSTSRSDLAAAQLLRRASPTSSTRQR